MEQSNSNNENKWIVPLLILIAIGAIIAKNWKEICNYGTRAGFILLGLGILVFSFVCLWKRAYTDDENILTNNFMIGLYLSLCAISMMMPVIEIDYSNFNQEIALKLITVFVLSHILLLIEVLSLIVLLIYWANLHKKNKDIVETFEKKLSNIKSSEYMNKKEVFENINNLQSLVKQKISKKYKSELDELKKSLQKRKNILQQEEEQNRIKDEIEKHKKLERQRLVSKLLDYFLEENSTSTIPEWAIDYNGDLIYEAEKYFKEIKEKKEKEKYRLKRDKEDFEEAVAFVNEHKAYPSNFHKLEEKDKDNYHEAMILLRTGDIKKYLPKRKLTEDDEEILEMPVYVANDLSIDERQNLVNLGYRHKPFIFIDGTSGNNLYIKNESKNESDYHLCMKYLFKDIDKKHAIIEYCIEQLRADVAFIYDDVKIAVEIETGNNNDKQIDTKVRWLNENFDYWIFVCSRQNKTKYKKYANNKQSFCLTLKEARDKLLELIKEADA